MSHKPQGKTTLRLFAPKQFKLPFLFWLGMITLGLFLWAMNSFMVYQNQGRITQSAELSANSLASYVSDYIEKHQTLVKSVAHHHQDRILNLAKGGGFPYDLQEIQQEVESLFPKGTEFAIVDRYGTLRVGNRVDGIGPKCKKFIQNTMKVGPSTLVTVKPHRSPQGIYHFDIIYPVIAGEDYAGLWLKLSFESLETYIKIFNVEEYELVVTEQVPPYNMLIGGKNSELSEVLNFDFIEDIHSADSAYGTALALAPIQGVPWQVRVIENKSVLDQFYNKVTLASALLFLVAFALIASLILMTRQFQKEREKLKQDAEHDELFNAGPTVLLEKSADRSMQIKYASPNAATLLKLDASDIVGRSYLDWIYPEDIESVREQLLSAYKSRLDKVEMVYRIRRDVDAQFKWIYDFTHIQYNGGGNPDVLRGYITSIHAQKTAEKNAIDLIQSVPEAIFVTEMDGRIVNMNHAAEQMLGASKTELKKLNFGDWLDEESFTHYERTKQRYLIEGRFSGQHFGSATMLSLRNLDGEKISVEIGFNKIELNGIDYLIQVVRDTTMQMAVQKQLSQAKEQAESLARARSRFVATISHEIRTPMNGVLGMADLLSETQLNNVQLRYLQAIKQSGSSLLNIINEVLDFARLDEGHVVLVDEPFNLKRLINESVHLLSTQSEDKGLSVEVIYPSKALEEFIGDANRVKQLLLNLLSNAIKFTEKGYVRVYVEQEFDQDGHYQSVQIKVADSGIGIAKENQAQLFDSFTQADDSTSRKFGGTGLGLAISKQLVDLMGGQIGVKSNLGSGSEFWIRLPLRSADPLVITNRQQQTTGSLQAVAKSGVLSGKTVLVVEDNEINQIVIEEFLNRLGAKVDLAENGLQCVDYWRMHPNKYHLILMDCQMPVMDGFEATKMIRMEESHMHIDTPVPIIALTANVILEDRQKCFDAGMDEFLTKPIERDVFDETVVKWVR